MRPRSWGFPPWVPGIGAALAGGGLVWALLSSTGQDHLVAIVLTVGGLSATIAGWRMRDRLIADTTGLTVRSILFARQLPWSDIESVTTTSHRRLGSTSTLLEINLHDESMLAFSAIELGAKSDDVAAILRGLHADAQR